WNHPASYARLPTYLEDIRLLLDQQSEAQWTPYEDPVIRAIIPDEYFQNPNAWHVKVALVNYATWRYTSRTEYYGNLDSSNQSPWHLRCWMIIKILTYGNCIRFGRDFGHTTSKCGKITVFTIDRGEAEAIACPKGTTWPFKSKKKGRRGRPINEAQSVTRPSSAPIQSSGPETAPTQSPNPTVQLTIPTAHPFQMMPGALESMAWFISIFDYAEWTADVYASVALGIARGAVGELFFFPIPITVGVSNTFSVGDANTSTVTILSRWLIVLTPRTRSPIGGSRISTRGTTTLVRSYTKEETSA
ncbi:hypothetical protein Goshw_017453, partial [Gossypium schwendimanii]|nr:hypothetical protein [Gossypium schwendimanii]